MISLTLHVCHDVEKSLALNTGCGCHECKDIDSVAGQCTPAGKWVKDIAHSCHAGTSSPSIHPSRLHVEGKADPHASSGCQQRLSQGVFVMNKAMTMM